MAWAGVAGAGRGAFVIPPQTTFHLFHLSSLAVEIRGQGAAHENNAPGASLRISETCVFTFHGKILTWIMAEGLTILLISAAVHKSPVMLTKTLEHASSSHRRDH